MLTLKLTKIIDTRIKKNINISMLILLLIILLSIGETFAQQYPTRAVRIIVPVATGGATDILTRHLALRLNNAWSQPVIVDNRPGGGSNVGFELAATAHPDGYTLLMAQPAFTVNVSLYKKLAYDPLRDFSPIVLTAIGANVLVIHPSVPARTLKDFIALAKAKPGKLNYASSGNGTTPHLSGELFKSMAQVDIVHVPYRGAGASITDLMGGNVDLAFLSLSSVLPQLNNHKLRALAITSSQRSAFMPELPTFSEAGLKGYEVTGWYGLLTQTNSPKEIIQRIHSDVSKILQTKDMQQALNSAGLEVATTNSPEEFSRYLKSEIRKWAHVVKLSGAKAD
jgi:tripartite-type tricarboxylate transporter receptor subunit TctC